MGKDDKKPKIPKPRRGKGMFQCPKCGASLGTLQELVKHDFKEHPSNKND